MFVAIKRGSYTAFHKVFISCGILRAIVQFFKVYFFSLHASSTILLRYSLILSFSCGFVSVFIIASRSHVLSKDIMYSRYGLSLYRPCKKQVCRNKEGCNTRIFMPYRISHKVCDVILDLTRVIKCKCQDPIY